MKSSPRDSPTLADIHNGKCAFCSGQMWTTLHDLNRLRPARLFQSVCLISCWIYALISIGLLWAGHPIVFWNSKSNDHYNSIIGSSNVTYAPAFSTTTWSPASVVSTVGHAAVMETPASTISASASMSSKITTTQQSTLPHNVTTPLMVRSLPTALIIGCRRCGTSKYLVWVIIDS